MNATFTINDLLKHETSGMADFGVENVQATLEERVAYINAEVDSQISDLAEKTIQARRLWGASASGNMQEFADDIGNPEPYKGEVGQAVHFPLRRFSAQYGRSWLWEKTATPADAARAFLGIEQRYVQRQLDELAFAIYNDDNYSFVDTFGDGQTLSVKAALNNDGVVPPPAPDGSTFLGTHQHYNGTSGASLASADINALIDHVREHFNSRMNLALFVNEADVSVIAALASDLFEPLTYAPLAVTGRTSGTLEVINPATADLGNSLRGYWDGVPVMTRPWAKDNYIVCVNLGAMEKPLVYRTHPIVTGLMADPIEERTGQVLAKYYHSLFGISVWNRAAIAVLDTAHQTTYTEPTLIR